MKRRLEDIVGNAANKAEMPDLNGDAPQPATLEVLLRRDLDAWQEAKAAILRAKG